VPVPFSSRPRAGHPTPPSHVAGQLPTPFILEPQRLAPRSVQPARGHFATTGNFAEQAVGPLSWAATAGAAEARAFAGLGVATMACHLSMACRRQRFWQREVCAECVQPQPTRRSRGRNEAELVPCMTGGMDLTHIEAERTGSVPSGGDHAFSLSPLSPLELASSGL